MLDELIPNGGKGDVTSHPLRSFNDGIIQNSNIEFANTLKVDIKLTSSQTDHPFYSPHHAAYLATNARRHLT